MGKRFRCTCKRYYKSKYSKSRNSNIYRIHRRNKVKYIKKRKFRDGEFIDIETSNDDGATLPYFKAGTMYKGMELDREYSLEELGL